MGRYSNGGDVPTRLTKMRLKRSRFMTEKVDPKSRNLSCRVVNSVDF